MLTHTFAPGLLTYKPLRLATILSSLGSLWLCAASCAWPRPNISSGTAPTNVRSIGGVDHGGYGGLTVVIEWRGLIPGIDEERDAIIGGVESLDGRSGLPLALMPRHGIQERLRSAPKRIPPSEAAGG